MGEDMESPLAQPSFWQLPLADRMAQFAEIREQGAFVPVEFDNPMQGVRERFHAVTRYDEVVSALGCHGELVRSPDELRPALDRAFASGKPALVNVLTDPDVVYPRRANLA